MIAPLVLPVLVGGWHQTLDWLGGFKERDLSDLLNFAQPYPFDLAAFIINFDGTLFFIFKNVLHNCQLVRAIHKAL